MVLRVPSSSSPEGALFCAEQIEWRARFGGKTANSK